MKKIVFEGTTKYNHHIVIRYPKIDDLHLLHAYINTLSRERTYILYQGQTISMAEERTFLLDQLKKIQKHQTVMLLAFSDELLVGVSSIDLKDRVTSHEGVFGISIAKRYRQRGIGSLLMKTVLDEAVRYLPKLKIVTLGVFANNPTAQKMYKTLGFRLSGKIPRGIYHKGKYVDHLFMYKFVAKIP